MQSPEWMLEANCVGTDPEAFFPTTDAFSSFQEEHLMALQVCAECPVQRKCLEFALATECVSGTFGGVPADARWPLHGEYARACTPAKLTELVERGMSIAQRALMLASVALMSSSIPRQSLRLFDHSHGYSKYRREGCRCQICVDSYTAHQLRKLAPVRQWKSA